MRMDNFFLSLQIMGFGMLGIFIVMILIAGVVVLLSKVPTSEQK